MEFGFEDLYYYSFVLGPNRYYEKRLSKAEKIKVVMSNMEFNIRMYEKYKKHKNNRYDKKELNYNQWILISQIEYIKKNN